MGKIVQRPDQRPAPCALFDSVPIAPLVYFRIVFGGVMIWEVCRYLAYGWVDDLFLAGPLQFKYYGFEWVRAWPQPWANVHFVTLGVLAGCMALGLWYRVTSAFFFVGFAYVFLLDQTYYLNHLYLVCLLGFLLMLLPVELAGSLDTRRRPELFADRVLGWTLWLLRFQIGLVYFFGGIAKLNADWLRGEPIRTWLEGSEYPIVGRLLGTELAVQVICYGGLFFDLLVVPALLWRRTRAVALVAAVAFHLVNALVFRIGIFPWLMILTLPLFLPVSRWERLNARWFRRPRKLDLSRFSENGTGPIRPGRATATGDGATPGWRKATLALLAAYGLVQVLVPLRHLLYPGPVAWTEEGHRFSWRMKLRSKQGTARFIVTHPELPQPVEVNPRDYLTSEQRRKMATHPDMILQMSHWIAAEYRKMGFDGVQVRARVRVSLNGRTPEPLIDPEVDLAAQPRSLRPAAWIVPLNEPLPVRRLPWWPTLPESREGQDVEDEADLSEMTE